MTKKDYDQITTLIFYYMIMVVVSSTAAAFGGYIFRTMSERIALNIRNDFYVSIVNKDIAFFDERKSGDLISRMLSDIQIIQSSLSTNIASFVSGTLFIIAVLTIMCYISVELTGVTIACIIPMVLFSVLIYGKKMRKLTRV